MQISEIKELTTEELRERIEAEQASYQQKRIDHYVSPAENPACLLYTSDAADEAGMV